MTSQKKLNGSSRFVNDVALDGPFTGAMQVASVVSKCFFHDLLTSSLFVLYGEENGLQIKILKDDGCNSDINLIHFVNHNKKYFETIQKNLKIDHSNERILEVTSELVVNAEIQIAKHTCCSNWAISKCRYDITLGIPWHEQTQVIAIYVAKSVIMNKIPLPVLQTLNSGLKILNITATKFRFVLHKKGHQLDLQVYHVTQINNIKTDPVPALSLIPAQKLTSKNKIIQKYSSTFRSDRPAGLSPALELHHEIRTLDGARPPRRVFFQLSPSELLATKKYITDLLNKGKIRPSRFSYGARLFFVKQKRCLNGVIDYRAFNKITKRKYASVPRIDEMFDRFGKATVYSKLDVKAGSHQIRVKNVNIKNTAFKIYYGHFEFLVMPMGLCNDPATF